MMLSVTAVLPAQNICETIKFYKEKLSFDSRYSEKEYGIINKDLIEIHFWKCKDRNIAENCSCRIEVDNIDEVYASALKDQIVHPKAKLEQKHYRVREFAIVDNNGNLIWFFERIPAK